MRTTIIIEIPSLDRLVTYLESVKDSTDIAAATGAIVQLTGRLKQSADKLTAASNQSQPTKGTTLP